MAVWVYKDNEKELIDPTLLHAQLVGGWSLDDPETFVEAKEMPLEKETTTEKKSKNKD